MKEKSKCSYLNYFILQFHKMVIVTFGVLLFFLLSQNYFSLLLKWDKLQKIQRMREISPSKGARRCEPTIPCSFFTVEAPLPPSLPPIPSLFFQRGEGIVALHQWEDEGGFGQGKSEEKRRGEKEGQVYLISTSYLCEERGISAGKRVDKKRKKWNVW